jgi:membrane-bound lytic murein transglycosylase B
MRKKRRPGVRFLIPLTVIAAVLAPATPAQAQTQRTHPSAEDAQARAMRARARVDAWVDAYAEAERAVARGLSRVTAAYAMADSASVDADKVAQARQAASAKQAADIRAVYVSGGTAWLTATLLGADSPTELLWRQSTNSQVMSGLLASDQLILHSAEADSRLAARRAEEADEAAEEQAAAMSELRTDAESARGALADARRTLGRLDREAQRARAAEQARKLIADAERSARAERRSATGSVTALGIPEEYEAAYKAAAGRCPGLTWTLLAAVGQVESGHGRNVGPSSAGAEGPMQFMPGTFAAYGVDGDHDGVLDIWDPEDAIFSAANYLCASGLDNAKQQDSAARVRAALYAYNRADWYVDLVLSAEQAISAHSAEAGDQP